MTGPITAETHPSKIKHSINDKIDAQKKQQGKKTDHKKKTEKHSGTVSLPPGSVHLPQGGDVTLPGEDPYPTDIGTPTTTTSPDEENVYQPDPGSTTPATPPTPVRLMIR